MPICTSNRSPVVDSDTKRIPACSGARVSQRTVPQGAPHAAIPVSVEGAHACAIRDLFEAVALVLRILDDSGILMEPGNPDAVAALRHSFAAAQQCRDVQRTA